MSANWDLDAYPYPSLRLLTALHELDDEDSTEAEAPPETVVGRAVAIPLDRRGRAGE